MKYPHLLPQLVTALNEHWLHFYSLFNRVSEESRRVGTEAVIKEMALTNEHEIAYVTDILSKFTFAWMVHDEPTIVDSIARIAKEPEFYNKYEALSRIPQPAEFLPLTPPVMTPAVEAPLSHKRKNDEGMDAATAAAAQFFLESHCRVLKRHPIAAAAAEVFNFGDDRNEDIVIAVKPFKLKKRSLSNALNARLAGDIAINQLLDTVPDQHLLEVLRNAKRSMAISFGRDRHSDERRIGNYFYFYKKLAQRFTDPKQKFEILYDGLELLVDKTHSVELENFVATRLKSLEENEHENFVEQARLRFKDSKEDLHEVINGYIAEYDKMKASQEVSFTP